MATRAEALPAADLLLRSRHATPGIPPGVHPDDEVRKWFQEVAFASWELWVVGDGAELRAMMVLNADWIEQLFVSPEHLRRGYGSRLLKHAQSMRSELRLWCFAANTPARVFYEHHGFCAADSPNSDNEESAPAILHHWARPAHPHQP